MDFNRNAFFFFIYSAETDPGPTGVTCGSPADNVLACSILEFFIILGQLLCKINTLAINIGNFLACVMDLLPPAIGALFQIIINGLVNGGEITLAICPYVFQTWNASLNSLCPGIYSSLNILLSIFF